MYEEIYGDLFQDEKVVGREIPDTYIVHCISSDYALGAGFAKQIEKRYRIKNSLLTYGSRKYPDCLTVKNIINMVTKDRYWDKPTIENFEKCLEYVVIYCKNKGIKQVIMPMIGSGLDKLPWDVCSNLIKEHLVKSNIEVKVYYI